MNDREILEKAIQKAIEGGWNEILSSETWVIKTDRGLGVDVEMRSPYSGNLIGVYYDFKEIIFDHDFAKALWSSEPVINGVRLEHQWEKHLQRMVIADDPIKYLGENMGEQLSKESEGETV